MMSFQFPVFDFEVLSGSGLKISSRGVPVVRGSWFQYYEKGWKKGYYSSNWQTQTVERVDGDTVKVSFTGSEGRVSGWQVFHREQGTLHVLNHFEWNGEDPAMIETGAGQIWAPAFESGTLRADGKPTRALTSVSQPKDDVDVRRFSPDARRYEFKSNFADFSLSSSIPLTVFDARNGYPQDWAEGKQLWWAGAMDLEVAKGKPVEFTVDWNIAPHELEGSPNLSRKLSGTKSTSVFKAVDQILPLIPQPLEAHLDYDKPMELSLNHAFPAGRFRYYSEFLTALGRRFEMPAPTTKDILIQVDGGVHHMKLRPGGYSIEIKAHSISVLGEEEEGLRMGLQRLAQLAFVRDGKLWLPTGTIVDNPKIGFRGVHLFVGKNAPEFQKKLWDRVLRPMGFNRVVLQCEQTQWDALDGNFTGIAMPKDSLVKLFKQYRDSSVEPIPLIQSFGHMEWLFAHKKNLELAFNPDEPYAIDPRKPAAQAKVAQIWDEAIEALKPTTVHFGLDEVDMRGHKKSDPALVTEMWEKQLAFLGDYAKRKDVRMMIWGDKALAPGEAPDAALGDNKWEAEHRRAAIPKRTIIADWHYKADSRPKTFYPVLQLWKSAEMRPIAAAWYRPENVRGFDLAAVLENCGTLQTTWAGYESNEEGMIKAFPQFSAMVLAGDYSWSGRQDELNKLGYDPAEVFRRMYFGKPVPLVGRSGELYGNGKSVSIEGLQFNLFDKPLALQTRLTHDSEALGALTLSLDSPSSEVALCLDTQNKCDDGDPVAEITLHDDKGLSTVERLVYGRHVRARDDAGAVLFSTRQDGLCAFRLPSPAGRKIVSVSFRPLSTYAGLRILGLTSIREH